ncbi:hypothetical protein [Metabacillus arenae]|uniref:Uncharacterized protein n=1 Tax=Metabacillus arenae TaxID=2771434 RepID=A0A926N9F5_9BACI|nr:hypothetical protein [Metabacillus arenae]MBD1379184.1 hypothetical protein [Metabacillus arenae]
MVYKTILKVIKKFTIPFGAVSSSFLFTNIAKAESNWMLQNEGILYKAAKHKVKSEGGDDGFFETWGQIGDWIISAIKWFVHLPENIAQLSVNLLTKLYELLMFILQTPLFIFNNSYIQDATLVFTSTSILMVTILTLFELMKRMFKKKHTDFKKIMGRWSLAVVGSGFAPFLFEQTFNLLNMLSKAITKIGVTEIRSEDVMTYLKLSGFNTVMLVGFDLILIAIMIPIFLQNFRRFFDLMCLGAITPLALTAWVFDDHRHYFNKWWNHLKALGTVQIVYSLFICLLGIFIFGTRNMVDGGGLFLKLGIALGGLYRLANPPQFIKSKLDNGDDIFDVAKDLWRSGKNVWSTVTLKPTRLFLQKKNESKLSEIQKLRKKHGQRFVKGLS